MADPVNVEGDSLSLHGAVAFHVMASRGCSGRGRGWHIAHRRPASPCSRQGGPWRPRRMQGRSIVSCRFSIHRCSIRREDIGEVDDRNDGAEGNRAPIPQRLTPTIDREAARQIYPSIPQCAHHKPAAKRRQCHQDDEHITRQTVGGSHAGNPTVVQTAATAASLTGSPAMRLCHITLGWLMSQGVA